MAGEPNIPEGIIAEFRKKAKEVGIHIDLKNLDERINRNTSHWGAFPEICEFEYKSKKDLNDIMTLLTKLWNSYPREEFGGKTPEQVFDEGGKEADIKMLLTSELMRSMDPNDFSSEKEFKKAVDDFQKKWLNTPRKDLGGKAPMDVVLEEMQKTGNTAKGLHISIGRRNARVRAKTIESFFSEVPEKERLKTIAKKEEEYADLLGAIEFIIAQYYLAYPKITDNEAARALKNLRQNYDGTFGDESLECAIQIAAREGLKEFTESRKISKHEFLLVLDYVLMAISNRNWMGDKRAYMKWICNFFGLLKGKAKGNYEKEYALLRHNLGLSKEQISVLKNPPSQISDDAAASVAELLDVGRNDPCPCGSGKKYKK